MHKADNLSWTGRVIAATGYIWILCLAPLLVARGNQYLLFHGKQGLLLYVIWFIWWVVGWPIVLIPFFGQLLVWAGYAILAVASLFGIIQALRGYEWEMPIVGSYARGMVF